MAPLQGLEHGLHPFVSFVVMPIFALSNAGVRFSEDTFTHIFDTVTLGVFVGLLLGKTLGVALSVLLVLMLKWAELPNQMLKQHVLAAGLLASIGFTMSLFISELAFEEHILLDQAKIGVLAASLLASISGYFLLKTAKKEGEPKGTPQ